MPHSYQCNDDRKITSNKYFGRRECGLPEEGFIFTCFSNIYKIDIKVFKACMKLLLNKRGSVLWLLKSNIYAESNIREAAKKSGVNPERIIFANRVPLDIHLARHKSGDLFLDTFNYNSHTTASDALWAGMPLVTLKGKTFSARVGASLLTSLGIPELITSSVDEYIDLALELANNKEYLHEVRLKIQTLRKRATLFNSKQFLKDIEDKYLSLIKRR